MDSFSRIENGIEIEYKMICSRWVGKPKVYRSDWYGNGEFHQSSDRGIEQNEVAAPDYKLFKALGDRDGDAFSSGIAATESDLCIHEIIEFDSANWIKIYKMLDRRKYSLAQLQMILESTYDPAASIATVLAIVDRSDNPTWWTKAAKLARTKQIELLEEATYVLEDYEAFIINVLALVHYETFRNGCTSRINLEWRDRKLFRSTLKN